MIELSQAQAFIQIYASGSFSKAAQMMHLSQPAISRRIQLLEQTLGAPLFERIHSGVQLTAAGERFLPFAQRLLATAVDGAAAVRALREEIGGQVRLALVGTLASTQLTQHLRTFREQHPQVKLRLRTARSKGVSAAVLQGAVDLGLRYFPDPHPDLTSQPLFSEALAVVCAAQHPLVASSRVSATDLVGETWVSYPLQGGSSGEPFARLQTQKLSAAGLGEVAVLEIDSLTAQKRLIEANFGVGLLPASSIEEELRLGTLHQLTIPELVASAPVVALTRRDGFLSSAALSLLEMCATL